MSRQATTTHALTRRAGCVLVGILLHATPLAAQQPGGRGPGGPGGAAGGPRAGGPKPYAEVIPSSARSESGVLTVHRVGEKVYYELPAALLGKEMLWSTEIAAVPTGAGYGGTAVGTRIVQWSRRENRILLRELSYRMRGDGDAGTRLAVELSSFQPIIMAFDVEAEGKENSAVIDVTRLLTTDVAEFSPRQRLGAGSLDSSRTYVDQVRAFPRNVEVRTVMTFTPAPASPLDGLPFRSRRRSEARSLSSIIHYSLVLLPEKPMRPRTFDSRVGYFTTEFENYATEQNRVATQEYISRYRLEKKDPTAAVSDPVKPIVYYMSREVPEKWRDYVKQGVEDWNEAFLAAGFSNAIVCQPAPTVQEDPRWDPEDVRYSVIRWAANPTQNAMGPHVADPRTGEIISAHIIMWHDVLKLNELWYFVQAGGMDPQSTRLPLPKALMGELLRYVVAHEVGHTLGLRHNHKASSTYTVQQLRDRKFTEKYGTEASIMDYGRMNYVAQPGDGARLIPKLGPYDLFAIEWGYKPIGGSEEAEKSELDRIAARQVDNPTLRFGGEDDNAAVDPTVQSEDLGSDPVQATALGLKNIARIAKLLITATTRPGEDYDLLKEVYQELLQQRSRELSHVVKLVGGVVETRYHAGRGGVTFQVVPAAHQAQAVRFLLSTAFKTPHDVLLPEIIQRVEPSGVVDRVLAGQRATLSSLLSSARIKRMMDHQALTAGKGYGPDRLVRDLQEGIWSELAQGKPVVDLYRRNLQRAYLATIKPRLGAGAEEPDDTDLRPILRGALAELAGRIAKSQKRAGDRITALHLEDCRKEIDRILNPKR